MLYYDTTSNQLLQYNGTKWVSDRTTSTKIVAASNASQALKDGADYVVSGNAEDEINAALTAAAGGKVYLTEGTYTVGASISIPNNTTLAGSGTGTIITIPNSFNADIDIIKNTDQATGTGVVIRDLKVNGNKSNQTSGYDSGIIMRTVGAGSGASATQGAIVRDVQIENVSGTGLGLYSSSNGSISGLVVRHAQDYGVDVAGNNNEITNSAVYNSGNSGIHLTSADDNSITNTLVQSNQWFGIDIGSNSDGNTISGNTLKSNYYGMRVSATNNTIVGNTVRDSSSSYGIYVQMVTGAVISGNTIINSGGATVNDAIYLDASDNVVITGNTITDTSASTTNYAINIFNNTSDKNYLADNVFSSTPGTSTINDAGTGTTFANQAMGENGMNLLNRSLNSTAAFTIQGTNKVNVLNVDTTNGELELGSSALAGKLVISDGANSTVTLSLNTITGDNNYTLAIPAITGNDTLCLVTAANCANGTLFIQNQNASQQAATNFWISGTARADTSLQAPLLDTATAVALNIGTTNATVINLNEDTTVAAGKSLTLAGGVYGTRPASPTEGMLYFDTTSKQLLTYSNGKWQADSKTAAFIVAASDSSQADKDGAQYLANGEDSAGAGIGTLDGDQIEINNALTAAATKGGTVYLAPGTYTVDASISIPNNVTLAGSGASTLVRLGNFGGTSTNITAIVNTDITTGTGVVIKDLRLDGRKSINTAGSQYGVYLENMGDGSGASATKGAEISGVTVKNFRSRGIELYSSNNNILVNNTVQDIDGTGIYIGSSNNNTLNNNTVVGNAYGIGLQNSSNNSVSGNVMSGLTTGDSVSLYGTSSSNTLADNMITASTSGIQLYGSNANNNTITGNTISSTSFFGIGIQSSHNNTVSGNKVHDSGGATNNDGVYVLSGDANTITGNDVTDTSATTTNFAINIINASSDKNYLADNRFSSTPATATINDAGTGTVYANQSRAENGGQLTNRTANNAAAFTIQNASGVNILTADTSAGEIEIGSASLAGKLVLSDGSSNTVTLAVGAMSSNYTLTLPSAVGASGDCLKTTDASGTLAFSSCGGISTETVGFVPEYSGAVIQGDGSDNSGTMYSGFVNGLSNAQGVYHNYYEWYTAQTASQDYDIIVVNQLPADFNATNEFAANSWKFWTYADNLTDAAMTVTITNNDSGTETTCVNAESIKPGSATTWEQKTLSTNPNTACVLTAGERVVIKIKLTSKSPSTNKVRLGEFEFAYAK